MPKRNKTSGPFPKNLRMRRQNEVARLYIEYGYSARKIASVINVNRNTVNKDLRKIQNDFSETWSRFNPEGVLFKHYFRCESQRTRIRETLDKTTDISKRMSLEKMLLDIDSKMPMFLMKIYNSHERIFDSVIQYWNAHAAKNNLDLAFVTGKEITKVSSGARKQIREIIAEDRKPRSQHYRRDNANRSRRFAK